MFLGKKLLNVEVSHTSSQGGHCFLKVLENFSISKAPESPWKQIWCLKVLELNLSGSWKCLSSKIVNNSHYVKMMQSSENYEQYSEHKYYLLTWSCKSCIRCWQLWWNRFGIRCGCLKILEKSLISSVVKLLKSRWWNSTFPLFLFLPLSFPFLPPLPFPSLPSPPSP